MMIVDDPRDYDKWILLAYDAVLKRKLWFKETKEGIVETHVEDDVSDIVEANKASFNDSENKRWGGGKVVASIPTSLYFDKIVPAKLNGDDAYIKRWLNDSDNRAYRTFKGKV